MEVSSRNLFIILEITVLCFALTYGADCGCTCKWFSRSGKNEILCKFLEDLNIVAETNKEALLNWNKHFSFVARLSEYWKQDIASIVKEQLKKNGVKIGKTLEENPKFSYLEARLLAVENRTRDLEKKLAEEQEIRKQLERDVARTRATLIDLTEQIVNLTTSSAEIDSIMLPTIPYSPRFPDGFGAYLKGFVKHLNNDLLNLRKIGNIENSRVLNRTQIPGMFEDETDIFHVDALRLNSLEENVKALNASVGGILTTVHCIDCEIWEKWVNWEQNRGQWKDKHKRRTKEKKDKIRKSESYVTKPIWDDY